MMRKFSRVLLAAMIFLAGAMVPGHTRSACGLEPAALAAAAARYAPVLVQGADIPAAPEKILYRASTSPDNKTLFLAYHPVWAYEQDPRPGFFPALTRLTYTGGLKLQRLIWGPGDIEVLGITVDLASGRVIKVQYETATYDPKGEVIHVWVTVEGDQVPATEPLVFRVMSWNHLFELLTAPSPAGPTVYRLRPEPFTEELWKYYRMTKPHPNALSRDRAQFPWERAEACPTGN